MGFEEFIVATVAIVTGTALAAFIFAKIFGLVRLWLEGRSGGGVSREEYNRLGKAFVQHKKEVEERLHKLEKTTSGGNRTAGQLNRPSASIEMDQEEPDEEKETSGGKSNLKNMLRE